MSRVPVVAAGLALVAGAATPLHAQNSVFGVLGIGFPGRGVSVPARALGGGTAAFDPLSVVNPGAAGAIGTLTAMATTGTTTRRYETAEVGAGGLRETRFPLALLAGTVPNTPVTFAASFTTYAERTFGFSATDTVLLRGAPVEVTDRIGSDGAVVDTRGALAWQLSRRLSVGAAAHLLTGSTQLSVSREFGDSAYLPIEQERRIEFSGLGFSAGAVWTVSNALRLAGAVRHDTRLDERADSVVLRTVDLPLTVTGGVMLAPAAGMMWSWTAQWRRWSRAAADVAPSGTVAFDTWDVGTGIQIGGRDLGRSTLPVRVGVRYAQLPFAPVNERPREIGVAAGTGVAFAGNRGTLDVALERIIRDGAGMSERGWHLAFQLLLRP